MRTHQTGLLDHDPARSTPGYTLIATNGRRDAHLIDIDGNTVQMIKTCFT